MEIKGVCGYVDFGYCMPAFAGVVELFYGVGELHVLGFLADCDVLRLGGVVWVFDYFFNLCLLLFGLMFVAFGLVCYFICLLIFVSLLDLLIAIR